MSKEVDGSLVKLYDHTYEAAYPCHACMFPPVFVFVFEPCKHSCTTHRFPLPFPPPKHNRHTEAAQPRAALLAHLSFLRYLPLLEREALFGPDSQLCKDVFVRCVYAFLSSRLMGRGHPTS